MGAVRKLKPIDEENDAYLGVTASARGLAWRERLDPAAANTAIAISQRHEPAGAAGPRAGGARHRPRRRGGRARPDHQGADAGPEHACATWTRRAARLADAIERRETIAIFGDYDVDGACSCALLKRFLQAHGLDARIYIPDRMTEGYGPNAEAIEASSRMAPS